MKFVTFSLFLLLFTGFSSCENHMDINDIATGTPSNADTVLPHKFSPFAIKDTTKSENDLPKLYQR